MELNTTIKANIIDVMKVQDFVQLAKKAQATLRSMNMSAEHIYLVGYSDPRSIPSLVFVGPKYDKLDLYHRTALSSLIQQGPLKFNFYVVGTTQLLDTKYLIDRNQLYHAVKLYGKQPLIINEFEYASKSDLELGTKTQRELSI